MNYAATILLTLATIVAIAAALGYAAVAGVQTFPASVALYFLSLLATHFKLP